MRLNYLVVVLVLVAQSAYSQIDIEKENKNSTDTVDVTLDPVYFILGTLSDYMGRFQYVDRDKQIDRYYPHEKPLVDYLTEYIQTELGIVVDTVLDETNHSKMYSDEFSKTLNDFYGEKDELISNKFGTNEQVCSFLAGVYYRYGEKLDTSIYKIQIANSPKHQNCYVFLKQIGCENIFFKYLRNVPAQFILYFEPTKDLKLYLGLIESERIVLEKSFYNQIEDKMKEHMTKEKMEMEFQKSKDKEVERIKKAFER